MALLTTDSADADTRTELCLANADTSTELCLADADAFTTSAASAGLFLYLDNCSAINCNFSADYPSAETWGHGAMEPWGHGAVSCQQSGVGSQRVVPRQSRSHADRRLYQGGQAKPCSRSNHNAPENTKLNVSVFRDSVFLLPPKWVLTKIKITTLSLTNIRIMKHKKCGYLCHGD